MFFRGRGRNSPEASRLPSRGTAFAYRRGPVLRRAFDAQGSLNLPNILTCSRILLVPIFMVVLLTEIDGREFIGLAVFLTPR